MPLTYQEAYDLTNADLNEDQRKSAALALQAGTAANDIYWTHADTITALQARAAGHGAPPAENADERPGGEAAAVEPVAAEATAVEEPQGTPAAQVTTGDATEANPTAEVARLRALLSDHGIDPNATPGA